MIQKYKNYPLDKLSINFIALITLLFLMPQTATSKDQQNKVFFYSTNQKSFANNFNQYNNTNESIGFQIIKDFNNISYKAAINSNNEKKLIFDHSYIEYKNKNRTIGIGKIERNWSFSPNTSLILSSNARPSDSIYFQLRNQNKSNNPFLSWAGPWSLEAFNSFINNSVGINNSMLLGLRAVIEPIHDLKFEILKTSQWGGDEQSESISSLAAAIGGNTNEKEYSNINQMAGYGFSFRKNIKETSSRFYGQLIGEDEAGNLPSCYMVLIGNELEFPNSKIFSKLGIEFVDTRIDKTSNYNCGPNTAYNNGIYSYTNYNKTLGAPIDTESKSIHIWAATNISETTMVNYSVKNMTLNNSSWIDHRLNSSKKKGWIASIGSSWKLDSFNIKSNLAYQNFSLDKTNYNNGLSLGFNIEYIF